MNLTGKGSTAAPVYSAIRDKSQSWPVVTLNGSGKQHLPDQPLLFESLNRGTFWMGRFYELVACALFSGRLIKGKAHHDVESKHYQIESKAVRMGHHTTMTSCQFDLYSQQERRKRIMVVYFRHSFPKIHSYEGQRQELWSQLSERTHYGLILPFSYLERLHQKGGELFKWYCLKSGGGAHGVWRLPGAFLNELFLEPAETLKAAGLPAARSKGYLIEGIQVNGFPVRRFPVRRIYEDGEW